mgnify:CR=1 FL=1
MYSQPEWSIRVVEEELDTDEEDGPPEFCTQIILEERPPPQQRFQISVDEMGFLFLYRDSNHVIDLTWEQWEALVAGADRALQGYRQRASLARLDATLRKEEENE